MTFRVYPLSLIEENKWRAVRYGVSGNLLDLGKETERPARELIEELIGWFLDDVLDDLGSRKEVEYAFTILDEGTSADRQLETFAETGELKDVVDRLVQSTNCSPIKEPKAGDFCCFVVQSISANVYVSVRGRSSHKHCFSRARIDFQIDTVHVPSLAN